METKKGKAWDEEAARRAVDFAECNFPLADWQRDVVRQVFGRKAFAAVPRKNGKTAAIAKVLEETFKAD